MLSVNPEYRRLGLATLLAMRSIRIMKAEGVKKIIVWSEVCNEAALKLYYKLGFKQVKRLKKYYGNGSDAFKLCKIIKPKK